MEPLGISFDFSTKTVSWQGVTIPYRVRNAKPVIPDPEVVNQAVESYSTNSPKFKESDYNTKTTGNEIAATQEHLSIGQRRILSSVLEEFNPMFNRTLGYYPEAKVDINLKPNTKPIHVRPFKVPDKLRGMLKNEIDKLVNLEVLEPILNLHWGFQTFLIPKNDNTAHFVSDFRLLNKVIEDMQHPLPQIKDVLTRRM